MAVLIKLIKAAISTLLFSRAGRNAIFAGLAGLASWIACPSTITKMRNFLGNLLRAKKPVSDNGILRKFFLGALELIILKFSRKAGYSTSGALVLSTLGALLLQALKSERKGHSQSGSRPSGQVIDLDDFTVMDDRKG